MSNKEYKVISTEEAVFIIKSKTGKTEFIFNGHDQEFRNNTFNVEEIIKLEDVKLDTFIKRIKWIFTGKL
jgi:hypothetical protein